MADLSEQLIQIEQSISVLSHEEQLWLVERIIHNMRINTLKEFSDIRVSHIQLFAAKTIEQQLVDMANDPAIQAELATINQDFANNAMDGLVESFNPHIISQIY